MTEEKGRTIVIADFCKCKLNLCLHIFPHTLFIAVWHFDKGLLFIFIISYMIFIINWLLIAQISFWASTTNPIHIGDIFFPILVISHFTQKIIYLSSDNLFSNSAIILSHSHDNLVLKCLQCSILTQTSARKFLCGPLHCCSRMISLWFCPWVTMEIIIIVVKDGRSTYILSKGNVETFHIQRLVLSSSLRT